MTYIKRIHKRIHKHTTSILKCAVLALSVTLTATLQAKSYDNTQMNCLALVGYHEAKGESDRGMIAVMQVTMNRVKSEKFANTICGVVYSKGQYSWTKHNPKIKEQEQYERAKRLAYEVVNGKHHDISGKALFFVHVKTNRNWLKKLTHTCTIGNHKFFK